MEQRLNIEHPLFQVIRSEHHRIKELIQNVKDCGYQTKVLQELFQYAELFHHRREEEILFSHLAENPRLKEGGPMCSYYFDYYRLNHPVQKVESLLKTQILIEPHQKKFYDENLPVKIPTDEHRAGKKILQYLIENEGALEVEVKKSLFFEYETLQDLHFQKEETCFFHLCVNILLRSDADELLKKWEGHF